MKVCRPLRLRFEYNEEREAEMYRKEKDTAVCCEVMTFVKQYDHSADHDFNALQELLKVAIKEMKSKPKKKHIDLLQKYYTTTCPDAEIVFDSDGCQIASVNQCFFLLRSIFPTS